MQTKIDRNNIEDIIPLTPMQEGMLFHYTMNPDSTEYHEQISFGLTGDIDVDLLQKAWDFVIRKNEMLRSDYRWKDIDKPVQLILTKHSVCVSYHDLTREKSSIDEIKQADLKSRIDIENETLRITLCKCSENNYTMIISNHHILFDGWSSGIMFQNCLKSMDFLGIK